MKVHSASVLLVILLACGLPIGRSLSASISGGASISTEYTAEVKSTDGSDQYRFNIAIEPVMFRLQTLQGKYRLVRLRVWNATTAPLALSAERDQLEVLRRDGAPVPALLNPQRLDPAFWDALDATTRETLAYPVVLRGAPAAAPGGRPSTPESLYIYVLLPAQVGDLPESFRYTIASLNQTVLIRTRPPMAA
jgi:hypothetical protein